MFEKFRAYKLSACLFGLLGILFTGPETKGADAPSASSSPGTDSVRSLGEVDIQPHDSARLSLVLPGGRTWNIGIHRATPETREEYQIDAFVEPIFAMETFQPIGTDIPNFVKNVKTTIGGEERVDTGWILSSPELKILAKRALFEAQPALMEEWGYQNYNQISMGDWPVIHLVMRCFIGGPSGQYIGVAQTGTITRNGDRIDLQFYLSPSEYRQMKAAYAENDLYFVPSFTSKVYRSGRAKVDQFAELEEKSVNEIDLSSAQKEGLAPIFQSDVNRVVTTLKGNFLSRAYSTAPEYLPQLTPSTQLAERLFQNVAIHTVESLQDPKNAQLLEAINLYLAPHIEKAEEATGKKFHNFSQNDASAGDISKIGSRDTDETITTVSGGAAAAGSIGGVNVGKAIEGSKSWSSRHEDYNDAEKFQQQLNSLQNATGVTFTKGNSSSEFKPHSIKVYRLSTGITSMQMKEVRETYFNLGAEDRYLENSAVPAVFTENVMNNFISESLIAK